MSDFEVIAQALGKKKPTQSGNEWMQEIRAGFLFQAFLSLVRFTEMQEETVRDSLGIPLRTLARRKKTKRFNPQESESLFRFASVMVKAEDVLGSRDKARKWMQRENRALGGECPIGMLDAGIGFEQVMDVLTRIEYGVYS